MDKEKLSQIASKPNPTRDDVQFLLRLIEDLEKKNKALADHSAELSQEIENVKADFDREEMR